MKSIRVLFFLAGVFASIATAQDWQPLFDGYGFDGWVKPDGATVDSDNSPGWAVEDGSMHLDRSKGRGGNLLTQETYGDFELVFEWKLAEKSNNGVKYRVNDFDGRVLGIEYQVIDDLSWPKLKPKHKTASIYGIYEAKPNSVSNPIGEFNRSRILVQGNRIEHWLNGHLISEATVGSQEWLDRIAASKFHDVEGFGVIPTGKIMLTDHNDEVWYRNLFVRRLDVVSQSAPTVVCQPTATQCYPTRRRLFRRR